MSSMRSGSRTWFGVRGLLLLTFVCCMGWVLGTPPWQDLVISLGGVAAIVGGLVTFTDLGGAGSRWAAAQLQWQRRLPLYSAWADRTEPRHVYWLLGSLTTLLGAFMLALGVLSLVTKR